MTEAEPARQRSFAAARDDVLRDWTRANRDAQNVETYARLRAQYRIETAE